MIKGKVEIRKVLARIFTKGRIAWLVGVGLLCWGEGFVEARTWPMGVINFVSVFWIGLPIYCRSIAPSAFWELEAKVFRGLGSPSFFSIIWSGFLAILFSVVGLGTFCFLRSDPSFYKPEVEPQLEIQAPMPQGNVEAFDFERKGRLQ